MARRLLWLAVLGTAATWWLAAGPALADVPPSPGGSPTVSGTAQQGDLLTADPGTWSGDPTITFTYQWSDGQTGQTVLLSAADVGQSLTVTVTGTNDFGQASATSDPYGPVLPAPPAPANPSPTITGNAQQGDTLSVSNGGWDNTPTGFTYAWEDCDGSGNNCTPITGATSSSYTLQASDVGSTILATVTASNAGGQRSATTAPTASVLPAAPTPSNPAPGISGIAQQGDTLTVSNGAWNNSPTGFGYTWEDCDGSGNNCTPITGATSSSYVVGPSDVGNTIVAQVTASNAGGQGSAASAPTASVLPAAPTPGVPTPGIGGVAQQGDTLTVSNGTWNNKPNGFSYAWEDCDGSGKNCAPIAGATSSSYTLQASDVGGTVVAQVTASNAGGQGSATSAPTASVLPAAPTISKAPGITGTAQQGATLTVDNGTWNNAPTRFTYAWNDCDSSGSNCTAITGATSNSYTPQASDVGSTIVASVTAFNAGGQNSSTSAHTAVVLVAAPTPGKPPPGITGIAQQGDTLTVSNGTWNNSPTGFTYAWADCDGSGNNCAPITGATSGSYTLQSSDVGSTIVATVTASNAGGHNSASSAATASVLPAPPAPGKTPPGITGTAQQGHTLTVSNGTWTNNPTGFSYVWKDCSGSTCTALTGATASTYVLQASDVGSTIVATVTASNAGGQGSATSAATASILPAAPGIITAPGISGTPQQGKTLSVNSGAWSNNPTSYAYVWQDCGSTNTTCSAISGATSTTYTVAPSAVAAGDYLSVKVTATNSGGHGTVTTASVGPVLPPAPVNTSAPGISGTGATLTVSPGQWNFATGFSYAWESCDGSGANCEPIPGATSTSYALSLADVGSTIACVVTAKGPGGSTSVTTAKTSVVVASQIPPASQPTSTDLLITPSAAVTNQTVTLIATVTAGTSSTALWGTVTFENGAAAISGCANLPAVPSGHTATVACSTSFAASTAQLSAVFTPTSGSILKGSASPNEALAIGPDSTSTSLDATSSVTVGASTTYTATVTPPAARPGPVKPTGAVVFFDAGQPIGSCANQTLANGAATCTVTYAVAGGHQITARYGGDANFNASSSPADQVSAAPPPTSVLGTITATMQWAFYFTPKYTVVRNLVVNGAPAGATVVVRCQGRGCPFANHATLLTRGKRCGTKAKRSCLVPGMLSLTAAFTGRHLKVGTRVTISIVEPNWVGKSYAFTIRPRRGPRVQIGSIPVA